MTEQDWLGCIDTWRMRDFLAGRASNRKLRLFGCACCGRLLNVIKNTPCHRALLVAELYADGLATATELAQARDSAWTTGPLIAGTRFRGRLPVGAVYQLCCPDPATNGLHSSVNAVALVAGCLAGDPEAKVPWRHVFGLPAWQAARNSEAAVQVGFLRDIFDAPFDASALDPAWCNVEALSLAQAIYDERAFNRLSALADVLVGAGCNNDGILTHLRSPGPHVRGCWAVDLLLRKT